MKGARPTTADLAASVLAVKLLVQGMQDAMPALREELRRDACERLDDIITDLGRLRK